MPSRGNMGNSWRAAQMKKKIIASDKAHRYYNAVVHQEKLKEERRKRYLAHFEKLHAERNGERNECTDCL